MYLINSEFQYSNTHSPPPKKKLMTNIDIYLFLIIFKNTNGKYI